MVQQQLGTLTPLIFSLLSEKKGGRVGRLQNTHVPLPPPVEPRRALAAKAPAMALPFSSTPSFPRAFRAQLSRGLAWQNRGGRDVFSRVPLSLSLGETTPTQRGSAALAELGGLASLVGRVTHDGHATVGFVTAVEERL